MRITIFFLAASISMSALAADSPIASSARYQECTSLTRTDPSSALSMASTWAQESNTASANHCKALALFALKRYQQAADALEQLSTMIGTDNMMLWGSVLRQAAKSWELAEEKAKAIVTITKAIGPTAEAGVSNPTIGRLASELLLERSKLYASAGRFLYSVQDLDQALTLSPNNENLLLDRAKVFIALKEPEMARQDLQLLLHKHPSHAEALELMGRLR